MANLIDSGKRREFETGAVRDISEGKGRCDLLPLDVISDFLYKDYILLSLNYYIETKKTEYIIAAIRHFIRFNMKNCYEEGEVNFDEKVDVSAILELSKHYEDGCRKYGERNWEKGIPFHCFIDSGIRHYLKNLRHDEDERHDRAFLWNMFGLLWTIKHHPELDDLPNVKSTINTELDISSLDF